MSNLYADWPPTHLANLYWHNVTPNSAYSCFQLKLSKNYGPIISLLLEITKYFNQLLNIILLPIKSNIKRAPGNSGSSEAKYSSAVVPKPISLSVFRSLAISTNSINTIRKFDPQIIHCAAISLADINFILKISNLIKVPLVVHAMDDWVKDPRTVHGLVPKLLAFYTSSRYSKLINRATLRFAASDQLTEEYSTRYRKKFLPFYNCPESSLWIDNGRVDWKPSTPFHFVFTGALYSSCNLQSLLEFAQAIDFLNRNQQNSFLLSIHTNSTNYDSFEKNLSTLLGCSISGVTSEQKKIAQLYGSADALLIPFDFSAEAIQVSKYSLPTKLPAYMLSGSPIIAYGPTATASIGFIAKKQIGYTITEHHSTERLAKAIQLFRDNLSDRIKYAEKARLQGQKMSANVVRPLFINKICSISSEY